jgi:MFS family permease
LYILTAVQLLSAAGFSLVFPFLPLYEKELGIATGGSVEFWAGLVFSSQAITMMIAAPIWGAYADRYGRKRTSVPRLGASPPGCYSGFSMTCAFSQHEMPPND